MPSSHSNRSLTLKRLATRLAEAQDTLQWIEDPSPEELPDTLSEAYDVQDMVAQLRKDTVCGWKLGCTSSRIQKLFGVTEPIAGRIYSRDLHRSPAVLRRIRSDKLLVEGEFAFRMQRSLLPRNRQYPREEVALAVATLHPAIEYVQSRVRAWSALNVRRTVADNAGSGALVIGEAVTDWDPDTLPRQTVRLLLEGAEIASGAGADVMGNPLDCLVWLVNFLSVRGMTLRQGDIVTTGTCTGAPTVPLNREVVASFGDFGDVRMTFSL
jgi:2-keto-4-pentenoate hydratase